MSEEQKQPPEPAAPAPVQPSTEQPQAPQEAKPAVGFLVMAFRDEKAADAALDAMKDAKKKQQLYFEEAAVIRQDANGKVHYHETGDMSTGKGAGIGALVGGVLGVLGGPAGVMLAAGAGAAIGAAIAKQDTGFRDESLNTVGVALKPGTSAVAAITSHDFLRVVQKQVPIEQTRAAVRNLAANISARLNENKDMAVGLLLTEDGLLVKEIAANESSTEVVGAVITNEAVVAGAVVATAEGIAYQVAAATEEGAVVETGVVTEEGAVIVDVVAVPETTKAPPQVANESEAAAAEQKVEETKTPERPSPDTAPDADAAEDTASA